MCLLCMANYILLRSTFTFVQLVASDRHTSDPLDVRELFGRVIQIMNAYIDSTGRDDAARRTSPHATQERSFGAEEHGSEMRAEYDKNKAMMRRCLCAPLPPGWSDFLAPLLFS
ncbi:hypothetical protein CYMTET_26442 [Cymbomonas tetramitiformis]|uniref:Uncharacterized protein n=1 Tax=Cymbomonas tetramitiformis TaxID=36881 RepID=A0AAE0FSG0_9CHLO|nr:hypothetical protein CYMTET_26442 [Cymbomonas tetramitiformis]